MKSIHLSQNKFAIVSDGDYGRVNQHRWYLFPNGSGKLYAKRNIKLRGDKRQDGHRYTTELLHRFILELKSSDKEQVDHKNGNGLDCRRCNLRLANSNLNNHNRVKGNFTSKYKGVSWDRVNKKWVTFITCKRKTKNLGRFTSEINAARAYNEAASVIYGGDARLNDLNQ